MEFKEWLSDQIWWFKYKYLKHCKNCFRFIAGFGTNDGFCTNDCWREFVARNFKSRKGTK